MVLTFSCSWVLPLLTSLVAGDVFATEDRLGTWRHLLVAVRSPRRIFAAKALASLTVILLLVGRTGRLGHRRRTGRGRRPAARRPRRPSARAGAGRRCGPARLGRRAGADAGVRGGRAARLGRARPFSDGAGDPRAARAAAADRAAASAARRRARRPAELRLHRLARAVHRPGPDRPAVVGVAVSLVWAVVASALAYRLFMRRDFTDLAYDGLGRRVLVRAVLPLAALLAVTVAVIAGATSASGSGVDKAKLDRSLATAFAHLYRMQTGRAAPSRRHRGAACGPAPPATRAAPWSTTWDRATTGAAS